MGEKIIQRASLYFVFVVKKYYSRLWDLCLSEMWVFVDGWRDNHVLIFYTNMYYLYTEHTDELQLEDLQVAG
jgi:hypothetical protein